MHQTKGTLTSRPFDINKIALQMVKNKNIEKLYKENEKVPTLRRNVG